MHKEFRYFERDGVPRVEEILYLGKGDETPLSVADAMQEGDNELSQEEYERLQDMRVAEYEAKRPGTIVAGLHFARAVEQANGIREKQRKSNAVVEEKPKKKRAPRKRSPAKKKA